MPRSFRRTKGMRCIASPLFRSVYTLSYTHLHSGHRYCFDFVLFSANRQALALLHQKLPIGCIDLFNFEGTLDRLALERCFPAAALGTEIRASAGPLAGRIDDDVTLWQPNQPHQATLRINFPACDTCPLWDMPGPGSFLLLRHSSKHTCCAYLGTEHKYYTSAGAVPVSSLLFVFYDVAGDQLIVIVNINLVLDRPHVDVLADQLGRQRPQIFILEADHPIRPDFALLDFGQCQR